MQYGKTISFNYDSVSRFIEALLITYRNPNHISLGGKVWIAKKIA